MFSKWVPTWEKVAICGVGVAAWLLVTFIVDDHWAAPYLGGFIAVGAVGLLEWRARAHDPLNTTPEKPT